MEGLGGIAPNDALTGNTEVAVPVTMRNARSQRSFGRLSHIVLVVVVAAALLPAASLPAAAAPGDYVTVEQTDPRLAWAGQWATATSAAVSGGSHALSNAAGASVSFSFVGTQVDILGMRGPKAGIATVTLDGGAPQSFDCYAAESAFGQTVASLVDLAPGLHTVSIAVSGTKGAVSADAYVGVDAVRVWGDVLAPPVEQSDTRIVTRGQWASPSAAGASGGSHLLTNVAGAQVAIAFTGTNLRLVGMTGPKSGIVTVSVDGGASLDVDLYSSETRLRQIVFTTGELAAGAHTVLLTSSGRRNALASDTYVGLDAVLPTGTLTQAVMRYEETDPRLGWAGSLAASEFGGLSGGRYVWTGGGWGAVNASFVGTRLDWIATMGPQYGIASVRIDGGAPQYVDLYRPTLQTQQVAFSTGLLGYGQHTVTISWSGRANPAASGSYVSFDAFDIGGQPVQAAAPERPAEAMSFNYPWLRYIVVDKSDFRLYFVENGIVVKTYPIAHARVGATTPNAIWRIDAKYYSDPLGVYGPRKMRLFRQQGSSYVYTSYLIHGTNNSASIGTRASAGCIRMYNHDVLEFYPMVPLGTMVVTRD